jgi:phosphonopyruvate decarboxylase
MSPAGLERRAAMAALLAGRGEDLLVVSGLGSTTWDLAAAGDDPRNFYLWGAMGGAAMIGLGLALAQPDKQVLVVTGDGDLLMNVGALATIAVINPPNLAIVCVDNGHYGETGWQKSHTSLGADLETIAKGSGVKRTMTVTQEADLARGSRFIREGNSTGFVLLRVKPTEPPHFKRNLDAPFCRNRFRRALNMDL